MFERRRHISPTFSRLVLVLRTAALCGVVYGFIAQWMHPLFRKLTAQKFGGPFEYLTMISAALTILTMSFGLTCTVLEKRRSIHMHFVSILLPVELIVTFYYWTMYVVDREGITSQEMRDIGYLEFDHLINLCTHLVPFLGLSLDFIAELDYFHYRPWQGLMIIIFGVGYLIWLVFLFFKNKTWVYPLLETLTPTQFALLFLASCMILLLCWYFEIWISKKVIHKLGKTTKDNMIGIGEAV